MINPAVCGSGSAGVDDRIVFEFNPSVLNETSFFYDDFISLHLGYSTGPSKGPFGGHL